MRLFFALIALIALITPCLAQDAGLMPANTVFAGPTSGGAAFGTARAIVAGDINGLVPSFGGLTLTNLAGSGTTCVQVNNSGVFSVTGSACGSGSGAVNSVSNSDGTLTISPTTGTVVASLALGHANTWTAAQSFNSSDLILNGASSGTTTLIPTAAAGTTTATLPANTGTIAELNLAQSWTAKQTFSPSIQVPLVIGGAAVSSTLTLESTSAAGTTDKISFKTATQIERARIDTSAQFAETNFAAAFTSGIPNIAGAPVVLQADSNNTGYWEFGTQTYANSAPGGWATLVSRGSGPGTHTTAQIGDTLFFLFNYGDDGTNYLTPNSISVVVDNTPSTGNIPTKYSFSTGGSESLQIASTQQTITKIHEGYADLREWSTLSCNTGSPSSSNVGQAIFNASQAGWTHFFIPAGCYWDTTVVPGGSGWTARRIPDNFRLLGEDWLTSGVFADVSHNLTMGVNTSLDNLFYVSTFCFNIDSGSFGHPAMCPVRHVLYVESGSMVVYPFQDYFVYTTNFNIPAFGGHAAVSNWPDAGPWGIQNSSNGDVIFLNNTSTTDAVNFFNYVINSQGPSGQMLAVTNGANFDIYPIAQIGNSSLNCSVSCSGVLRIIDSVGSCTFFPASSGSAGQVCSSDEKLKTNITESGDQLAWLDSFKIHDFTLKADNKRYTGIIAQELRENHPEMVMADENGTLLAAGPELWKMVKVMQQMQTEIEELKQRVH